jgi:hypothetical protein
MGLTCKGLKVPAKPLFISVWTRPTTSSIARIGLKAMDLVGRTGLSGASQALNPCVLGVCMSPVKALRTPRRSKSKYPDIEGVRYFLYD